MTSTALVCLHGFTGDPASWQAVLAALDARGGRIPAWCPALLGHDEGGDTADGFAAEVDRLAAELRRRGLLRVHLAGYSLGARVALGLLVRHREVFAAATLVGVSPGLATEAERGVRAAADEALARQLEEPGGLARFVAAWERQALFASQARLPPATLAEQRRRRLAHAPADLARALRCLGLAQMPDYRPWLPGLRLPIRLLAGEEDEKFRRLAVEMASLLPRATVETVPAAGHNLILEAPQAVAAAIMEGLCDERCDD